jgi:hypothetical protein
MDIHDKTKEELISELKELLHEKDSLKELKEKEELKLSLPIRNKSVSNLYQQYNRSQKPEYSNETNKGDHIPPPGRQ